MQFPIPAHGVLLHIPPKCGSSAIAEAIIREYHPALDARLARARHKGGRGVRMKHGMVPRAPATDAGASAGPTRHIGLVRDPIERFRSGFRYTGAADVAAAIDALERDPHSCNPHVRPFSPLFPADVPIQLYRWPEHAAEFAASAGLAELRPVNVTPAGGKPELTAKQIKRLRVVYAEDLALHALVTAPGIFVHGREPVPTPEHLRPLAPLGAQAEPTP